MYDILLLLNSYTYNYNGKMFEFKMIYRDQFLLSNCTHAYNIIYLEGKVTFYTLDITQWTV